MNGQCLLVLMAAWALCAAEPKRPFETSTSQHANLASSGAVHIQNSYGYLIVEGWDQPDVETSVTKSTDWFGESSQEAKANQRFDQVWVKTDEPFPNELTISTALPVRKRFLPFTAVTPSGQTIFTKPLPPRNKRGVTVEYRVHLPYDSKLIIRHDNGYVWVSDLTADIEVHSHTGDLIVVLADNAPYAIDARTGLGNITSDLVGKTSHYLLGTHFTYTGPAGAHHLLVRMGRGTITIKQGEISPRVSPR